MKSDWVRLKTFIDMVQDGTKLSNLTEEELNEFADALDYVFQDVVFALVSRRIHALEDDDVTPGAQGGYKKANS